MPGFQKLLVLLVMVCGANKGGADFVETFEEGHHSESQNNWTWQTGDGDASMTFSRRDGMGVIEVDARKDRHNIWWAFIRHPVADDIEMDLLARPDRELRVEAKIRSSAAPRRVNLHFNHSRTTDFHSHLKEFDIPEADTWHVISMTTRAFDALPQDDVFVQMALMDWGLSQYRVDVEYVKVTVVDPAEAGPDLGPPLPYQPILPEQKEFEFQLPALQDGVVDAAWPKMNFEDWKNKAGLDGPPLIVAGGSKVAVMRWDLQEFDGGDPNGWGVLELTTDHVYGADNDVEGANQLRVVEILDGSSAWTRASVTWKSLNAGQPAGAVFNAQMMIDFSPGAEHGSKTRVPVSPPVLQRLFSGRSKGLAIWAQGAIEASFISGQDQNPAGPILYFNSN